jgi:hypothetical protein
MTWLALAGLLLAAPSRTVFPGGSIQPPPGCVAPAEIRESIDAFLGMVECPQQRLTITLFGGAMAGAACPSDGGQLRLQSANGRRFTMCATERRAARGGQLIKELVIDLGAASILAEVHSPQDALLLIGVAATFEPQ